MLRLGTLKASCLMSSPALPRVRSGSPASAVAENGTSLRFCSRRVAVTITSASVSDSAVSVLAPAARAAAGNRNEAAVTAASILADNTADRRATQFVVFIPNPSERSCRTLRLYSPTPRMRSSQRMIAAACGVTLQRSRFTVKKSDMVQRVRRSSMQQTQLITTAEEAVAHGIGSAQARPAPALELQREGCDPLVVVCQHPLLRGLVEEGILQRVPAQLDDFLP